MYGQSFAVALTRWGLRGLYVGAIPCGCPFAVVRGDLREFTGIGQPQGIAPTILPFHGGLRYWGQPQGFAPTNFYFVGKHAGLPLPGKPCNNRL